MILLDTNVVIAYLNLYRFLDIVQVIPFDLECGFEIKGGELTPQGEIIGFEKSVISVP